MKKIWWLLIVIAIIAVVIVGLIITKEIFKHATDNVTGLILPFL